MTTYVVEVDTTADRQVVAERSAEFAAEAYASVGRVLLERLGVAHPVPEEGPMARGEAGPPGAVVGIAVADTGSGPRIRKWRPDTVDKELARLRDGRIESLHLGFGVRDRHGFASGTTFGVDVSRFEPDEGLAHSFGVKVSAALPGAAEVFEAWAPDFFRRAVVALDATTGYVALDDQHGPSSPYETWCGWGFTQGLEHTHRQLRGYYWANLLTSGHLAALGGIDAVRAALPRADVEALAADAAIVWLPGTPTTVDWADREALHELVKPLLLTPRGGYSPRPRGR